MKQPRQRRSPTRPQDKLSSEFLLLSDGRVLAHNLTRPMAALFRRLNPGDRQIARRAAALVARHTSRTTRP